MKMHADFTKNMPLIAARIEKLENNRHVWIEEILFIVIKEFDQTSIIPYLDNKSVESDENDPRYRISNQIMQYYVYHKWRRATWRFIYDSRGIFFHNDGHYFNESDLPTINKLLELLDNIIYQQSIEFYGA